MHIHGNNGENKEQDQIAVFPLRHEQVGINKYTGHRKCGPGIHPGLMGVRCQHGNRDQHQAKIQCALFAKNTLTGFIPQQYC